jgi:hypothetical protein
MSKIWIIKWNKPKSKKKHKKAIYAILRNVENCFTVLIAVFKTLIVDEDVLYKACSE